ncbi:MAG: hypothetical protein ACNA8L_08950 [Luteolibacter sp.]
MMILLTIIAVGLLSLSAITLRTADQTSAKSIAESNARLALMIAIGELQKQMGPDQRISANADILSINEAGTPTDVPNPNWVGVWDAWIAGDLTRAPVTANYPSSANSAHQTLGSQPDVRLRPNYAQKNRHFRAWLLSIDPDAATNIFRPTGPALVGERMPTATDVAVRLVGEGSVDPSDITNFVGAQLIPIQETTSSEMRGRYAWWVGDESQKASIMEDPYESEGNLSLAQRLFRQQAAPSLGNNTVTGLETVLDESIFARLPSRKSLSLAGNNADLAARQFHDVTTASFGVLADVREGGLKRDLQTLLEREIDPAEVYNLINVDDYQRATSFRPGGENFILYHLDDIHESSVGSLGQASVPIQDLAAYYQLHDHYRSGWRGGIQYSSGDSSPSNSLLNNGIMVSNPDHGGTMTDFDKFLREYTGQYRSVVPVKTEIVLSYVTEPRTEADIQADRDVGITDPDTHILRMGITPSMTFWNPNNVPLVMNFGNPEHSSIFMRHRAIPLEIRIHKADSYDGAPTATHTVQMHRVTNNQQDELFTLFLSGLYPAVFQPGESKVFSLQFTSQTAADDGDTDIDFYLRGTGYRYNEPFVPTLELIPGWNPERFVRPTNRGATQRVGDAFTFKDGEFISAEIVGGTASEFDMHFSQKSRHGRVQPGVRWHYRSYSMRFRQNSNAAFKNDFSYLGFPRVGRGGIASTAPRPIRVPPRQASRLITAMGDPTDLTDDLPQSFFYYGVKSATETHESRNISPPSGGSGRRFPSRPFLHSTPLQSVFLDSLDGQSLYNYGWNWFFMPLDNLLDAPISISTNNHGYFGGGHTAENGVTHVVQQQLPLTPPISIASLSHARLGGFSLATEPPNSNGGEDQRRLTAIGHNGLGPSSLQAIGNSYAHPNIRSQRAFETWTRMFTQGVNTNRPLADHSYLANKALWDQFFMSSIFPSSSNVRILGENRTVRDVARGFFFNNEYLPNRRIIPHRGSMTEEKLDELLAEYDVFTDGFADKIGAYLMVKGPFNINSTSETAWRALFSSLKGKPISYFDKDTSLTAGVNLRESNTTGVPISSGPVGNRGTYTGSPSSPSDPDQWLGTRELTETEINELSRAIVRHVKMRGPFLSLSEFVNRRLDSTNRNLALKGALQAALDDPEVSINGGFRNSRRQFSRDEVNFVGAAFPEAMEGPIAYGSPAYVDQADILRNFPAQLTPRGDTFVIRTYGDALDASGKVIARAWCEATVQRMPEYFDPADEPHVMQANLTSSANRTYGRKFVITSFRWLNPAEV